VVRDARCIIAVVVVVGVILLFFFDGFVIFVPVVRRRRFFFFGFVLGVVDGGTFWERSLLSTSLFSGGPFIVFYKNKS
jgi:hypothetical protein